MMNPYKLNKACKRSFHEGLLPWLLEDIELEQQELEVMYKDYLELSVPKHKLKKIHEVAFRDIFEDLKIFKKSRKSNFKALRERNSEILKLITKKINLDIEEGQIKARNKERITVVLSSVISKFK